MTLSLQRTITAAVRPPRALFLDWKFGHPFGEAEARNQQLTVILCALALLADAAPGEIVDAPWRWRRESWCDPLAPGATLPDLRQS